MSRCAGEAGIGLTAAGRPDDLGAEQLVERYAERLYRLAMRITGSTDDAEKIVADALGEAARTIHRFEDESALGSWICRAVGREAYQRRARRQIAAAPLVVALPAFDAEGHFEPLLDWSSRIDEPSLLGSLRPAVAEALDELPADHRTALVLRDLEGAANQDIAEILGVDVPTARARVHRARLFVRQRLSEFFDPDRAALGGGANPSP